MVHADSEHRPRPPGGECTRVVSRSKLRGGIHAAKGPATVGGQWPVALVGVQRFKKQPADSALMR
ncbi:hypothetical protein EYC54_10820 [Xanthomonas oryzae]|nr:hypothetical protein EYC54_10820 [Xanthomonas oryzae]QBH03670.1 hypothetical protein EYC57_09955 [Xanthomonas oryzae]